MWYDDLEPLAEVTHRAFIDVRGEENAEGAKIMGNYVTQTETEVKAMGTFEGRIVFGLYGGVTPRTVENFLSICRGDGGLSYSGSPFHRVFWDFMVQGGDIVNGDGTGCTSMYGSAFEDEPDGLELSHSRPGLLCMANSGPDTNGCQFYITTAKAEFLDGEHVIFGEVLEGREVVLRIEECSSQSGDPLQRVVVTGCGQL